MSDADGINDKFVESWRDKLSRWSYRLDAFSGNPAENDLRLELSAFILIEANRIRADEELMKLIRHWMRQRKDRITQALDDLG